MTQIIIPALPRWLNTHLYKTSHRINTITIKYVTIFDSISNCRLCSYKNIYIANNRETCEYNQNTTVSKSETMF